MGRNSVELSKIVTDKKSTEDLYGQLDRLRRELSRILTQIQSRLSAVEEK